MKKIKLMTSMIIKKNDKILLLKRANDQTKAGMWNLPGGGVEEKENYEEAIKREVKEETNLDIVELKFFKSFIEEQENYIARPIIFYGSTKGEIKLDFENSEFGWFTKEEIKNLKIIYNQKETILEFLKIKN